MERGSSTLAIVLSTLAAILSIAVALLAFYLCRRHRRRRKRGEVVTCDDVDGDDETEGLRDAMEGLVEAKAVGGTNAPPTVVSTDRSPGGGLPSTGGGGRAAAGGIGGLPGGFGVPSTGVGSKWGGFRDGGGGGLGGGMGSLAAGVGGGLNALGNRFMPNGILSIKTPLISTKTLGAQLETAGGLPGKATSAGPGASSSIPEGKQQGAGGAGVAGGGAAGAGGAGAGAGGPGGSPGGAGAAQNKALANVKGEHPSMAFLQSRSISLVDMYIDNSEPSENVGQIHFSLEYDFQNTTLILRILQGKELPAKDLSGTSDPYVRVTLLPDKKHRLETKIKRRTLNPRWNETFYFEGFPIQKLQSRVLHLHVFDYDRFSRDDSIGEVFLPLCQVDLSEKPSFWKALKPPAKDKCGELLTSLCYHPSNSILTLTLLKARNLKAKDINGKSDPYVKVWLQFGEKRIEKRKTPIFKCTLNPIFNETFSFNVPWEKIRECSLDVMVMDFDNIGRNELIGRILLAGKNGSGASETKHWQDMITKPRQTIVQWHRLKPE